MSGKSGPDIVENGLVLCLDAANKLSYPGSGTAWTDLSGNSYNGTLTNGPTFSAGNLGSIVFDGANDYVDTTNSTGLNFTNTSGTVSLWFKTSVANTFLIAKNMDSTGGWGVLIDASGIPLFEAKNNASGASAFYRYVNATGTNNVWHNIVAAFTTSTSVVANNTVSMYFNGVLNQSALTRVLVYGGNTAGTIQLGRRTSGGYFNGNISNVQIYNRLLSDNEVLQNYNATKSRFGR